MGAIYLNGINYSSGGGGGGGTSDYAMLTDKPTINGVTLAEGQTAADLKLSDNDSTYVDDNGAIAVGVVTEEDIQSLFE